MLYNPSTIYKFYAYSPQNLLRALLSVVVKRIFGFCKANVKSNAKLKLKKTNSIKIIKDLITKIFTLSFDMFLCFYGFCQINFIINISEEC